ncbi:MAG TPA: response regulator transcription factor, partial [Terriglobia bacterium]|nr:response regulator transcription factor [Terriglobia bacterium]
TEAVKVRVDTIRPRLLLADDHAIVAAGLRYLLEPEFELIGIVGDGLSLIETANELKPDVIVTDISMPGLSGIEAARCLKAAGLSSKIIILTMHMDVDIAAEAIRAGVSGYVLKHSATHTLSHAIWEALKGRQFVSPRIAENVKLNVMASSQRRDGSTIRLTSREREVLQLVAEGHTIRVISELLKITTRTVEFHKTNIMDKLGLRTTADLTQYAISNRIIAIRIPEIERPRTVPRARGTRRAHTSKRSSLSKTI